GHQLRRDLLEAQAAATVGAEHVAAVELAADEGQAADHHAAAFGREVVGIVTRREAGNRDAGNALQGFGDAAVRQGADVLGGDRVDDLLGVLLQVLRAHEAAAQAGDLHRLQLDRRIGARVGVAVLRVGAGARQDDGHAQGQGAGLRIQARLGAAARSTVHVVRHPVPLPESKDFFRFSGLARTSPAVRREYVKPTLTVPRDAGQASYGTPLQL